MADRLKGKRVLIYGGGTGIGLGCAEAMMGEGASLFLSGRRAGVLEKAVVRLSSLGRVGADAGDATSVEDVQRVTGKAATFLRGIDTIVVSAGAGGVTPIFRPNLKSSNEFDRQQSKATIFGRSLWSSASACRRQWISHCGLLDLRSSGAVGAGCVLRC